MAFKTPITIKEAIGHIHNKPLLAPSHSAGVRVVAASDRTGFLTASCAATRLDPSCSGDSSRNRQELQLLPIHHGLRSTGTPQSRPQRAVHGARPEGGARWPATPHGAECRAPRVRQMEAPRLWRNNPCAFPERRLYLNLLAPRLEDEEELSYKFRLLPPLPDPKCPRRSLHANAGTTTSIGTAWETSSMLGTPQT